MKKIMMIWVFTVSVSSVAFCQTKISESSNIEAKIIALEKSGWKAWKDKNTDWFKKNTTNDFLQVTGEGTRNKADVLKATAGECEVKSFSLSDFRFVMLNETAALLSYTAIQDAVCNGKSIAPKILASVNYVKRGGKWLEAFYMETPVAE